MPDRRDLMPLVAEYAASVEMARARQLLGEPSVHLGGFTGASLAFFLSAWKGGSPGAADPALVVTATLEEAEELAEELEAYATVPVRQFPPWEALFLPESTPDGEIYRQRLTVLEELAADPAAPRFVVAPLPAIIQPVPPAALLASSLLALRVGMELRPGELAERLARHGLQGVPLVEARGEFSLRGDILDLFPYGADHPFRLEFFGDALESIREFQADTQRSIRGSEKNELRAHLPRKESFFVDCFRRDEQLITDYLGPRGRLFVKEPAILEERASKLFSNLLGAGSQEALEGFLSRLSMVRRASVTALPVAGDGPGMDFRFGSVERFRATDLEAVFGGIRERIEAGYRFEVYCESAAEAQRFREIVADHGLSGSRAILTRVGPVRRGFEIVGLESVVLTTRELFNRHIVRRMRAGQPSGRAIQSFLELQKRDLVVHLVHGVGRYLGMECFERDGVVEEFLAVEFRDNVKVYVPVSKIDLVQKYVGSGDRPVLLDRVGGTSWARKKDAVEKALLDLASELIEIQAMREARPGQAYPPASEWQREFEAAFPFEETPDQVEVSAAIHADMESPRPMDRLICGDVGFGKTELAMRAVFKAVDSGKQVAVLVPTTVLAQQHYRTFGERMSSFPVRIDVLSRFRTPAEQRETIENIASGAVDVIIGTHRLLSDDVCFRDLGLVIIDEEQRFGVTHKEKLKRMRSTVEVLTLTATPIPRTLHMALLGIRDISSLTTAPQGRCPVRTEIIHFAPHQIREIVIRELNRDGQLYFVHNRIEDILRVKSDLESIVPEARIEYAHGQMNEHELEDKMLRFFEGEIDCLISTTIIENGLDIPNVNTIFINEADRYGLADLHQLRGRVGRYKHQAYCYLVLPESRMVNPDAQKRLQALVEFSELGAGFQIAMRDLEIRGAGNILGPEQSGHIAAVGYDMYCRLLARAVRRLKNEPVEASEPAQVEIDLSLPARIPDEYRPGEAAKIAVYRRVSSAATQEAIDDLGRELEDRFGPYPAEVARLLDVQRLRLLCVARGIEYVGREEAHLVLRGGEGLRGLLEGLPVQPVIPDARTVMVPLSDPSRRYARAISDERVFDTAIQWMRTGSFPSVPAGAGRWGKPRGISSSCR